MSSPGASIIQRESSWGLRALAHAAAQRLSRITALEFLTGALCLTYIYLFWDSVSRWWFNPRWSTDDALQQVYPFHSVHHPEIFKGDFITQVMEGYLAPIHYWIGYAFTWLCGDAIMASHYMMLLQVVLAGGFLFLAVRHAAGLAPAFFALLWFFHTRHVMQRMTAGLPRGWAPVLFSAFFYFVLTGKHRAVLIVLFLGCLLNPPATFLIAFTYGLILSFRLLQKQSRAETWPHFLRLALVSPVFIATTLYVTHRPSEVGTLATLEQAQQMPEFSRDGGRFSYLPFSPPLREIQAYANRTFFNRWNSPSPFWRKYTLPIVLGVLALLALAAVVRKRAVVPLEVWCFGFASVAAYLAARVVAFHLYVPDRHLNIPLPYFFILALTIGVWRALDRSQLHSAPAGTLARSWMSALGLVAVAGIVYAGSQLNLSTNANFNYSDTKRGRWVQWLKRHTPETALIAGFPTFIDPVQLFSMRKAYATAETWHPFYLGYNEEIKRRIGISLRAHYAKDLQELVSLLRPEGVDYFVFERNRFYPDKLKSARYFKVFQPLLDELTSRHYRDYAYRQLPVRLDQKRYPFVVYRDDRAVIVDVRALERYLADTSSAG